MVVAVPMAVWGPLVCLASALGHHLASLGILRLLAGQHPALAAADLQFAANWAVSMLQAAAVTALGLLACWHTGADTAAADLPLMLPCGWWNLGYWLYDLLALFLRGPTLADFPDFRIPPQKVRIFRIFDPVRKSSYIDHDPCL